MRLDLGLFSFLQVTQIRFRRQGQQGFIHQADRLLDVIFMQHLHRGVHVTQGQ